VIYKGAFSKVYFSDGLSVTVYFCPEIHKESFSKRNFQWLICYFCQIIDSIMALFRVDFCGRGELADRQQKLAQMLSRLQKLSEGKSKLR